MANDLLWLSPPANITTLLDCFPVHYTTAGNYVYDSRLVGAAWGLLFPCPAPPPYTNGRDGLTRCADATTKSPKLPRLFTFMHAYQEQVGRQRQRQRQPQLFFLSFFLSFFHLFDEIENGVLLYTLPHQPLRPLTAMNVDTWGSLRRQKSKKRLGRARLGARHQTNYITYLPTYLHRRVLGRRGCVSPCPRFHRVRRRCEIVLVVHRLSFPTRLLVREIRFF